MGRAWQRLEWFGLLVLSSFVQALPGAVREGLFAWVMGKFGMLLPANRVIYRNLRKTAGLELVGEQRQFAQNVWHFWGKSLAAILKPGPIALEVEGDKHAMELLRDPAQPIVVATAHFGPMELLRRPGVLNHGGVGIMYRRYNNPLVEAGIQKALLASNGPIFTKRRSGAVQALKHLKDAGKLLIMVDQHLSKGVEVNVLGHPAMMARGAIQMAEHVQCPVVPARLTRRSGRWRVIVSPAMKGLRDVADDHQRLADQISGWITREPHLWLWLHRRWRVDASGLKGRDISATSYES